jgi:hypothetical protein
MEAIKDVLILGILQWLETGLVMAEFGGCDEAVCH